MTKILVFILLGLSFNAAALDLSQYLERLRAPMAKMLGEDVADKLLGKKKPSVVLPEIPQVSKDATSVEVYKKKPELEKQGRRFRALGLEQKRRYRVAFIQELYRATRNSEAKEGDVIKFLNVLEQGGSREGVYRAVVLDSVYASLESYEEAPEQALEEFVVGFGEKYLARKFDQKSVGKLNLWSIKRIVVEKTLDVMDALAARPEDLRAWYAVMSAQLANDYPQLWKNKTRQAKSADFHLKWAQNVPFQHIKSETIIKLHETMNYLNEAS